MGLVLNAYRWCFRACSDTVAGLLSIRFLEKIPDVIRLTAAEKLLLVSQLWEDLAAYPTEIPVSREHDAVPVFGDEYLVAHGCYSWPGTMRNEALAHCARGMVLKIPDFGEHLVWIEFGNETHSGRDSPMIQIARTPDREMDGVLKIHAKCISSRANPVLDVSESP